MDSRFDTLSKLSEKVLIGVDIYVCRLIFYLSNKIYFFDLHRLCLYTNKKEIDCVIERMNENN